MESSYVWAKFEIIKTEPIFCALCEYCSLCSLTEYYSLNNKSQYERCMTNTIEEKWHCENKEKIFATSSWINALKFSVRFNWMENQLSHGNNLQVQWQKKIGENGFWSVLRSVYHSIKMNALKWLKMTPKIIIVEIRGSSIL